MAEFEKKKHAQDEFNKGNKYVANDGVQPATINNLVENSLYTEAFAESLASTPDTTNVAQVGTPSVELVDNPSAGIIGAKKFKFSNLKGEAGRSIIPAENGSQTITYAQLKAYAAATSQTYTISNSLDYDVGDVAIISYTISDRNNTQGSLFVKVTGRNNTLIVGQGLGMSVAGSDPLFYNGYLELAGGSIEGAVQHGVWPVKANFNRGPEEDDYFSLVIKTTELQGDYTVVGEDGTYFCLCKINSVPVGDTCMANVNYYVQINGITPLTYKSTIEISSVNLVIGRLYMFVTTSFARANTTVTPVAGEVFSAIVESDNSAAYMGLFQVNSDHGSQTSCKLLSLARISGDAGAEVELRATDDYIQWKYDSSSTWTNLVSLSALKGDDGKNVELQKTTDYIQWRNVGDSAWQNLIALSELKGETGANGVGVPAGGTTGQVLKKKSGADYDTEWANENGGGSGANVVDIGQISLNFMETGDASVNITNEQYDALEEAGTTVLKFSTSDGQDIYLNCFCLGSGIIYSAMMAEGGIVAAYTASIGGGSQKTVAIRVSAVYGSTEGNIATVIDIGTVANFSPVEEGSWTVNISDEMYSKITAPAQETTQIKFADASGNVAYLTRYVDTDDSLIFASTYTDASQATLIQLFADVRGSAGNYKIEIACTMSLLGPHPQFIDIGVVQGFEVGVEGSWSVNISDTIYNKIAEGEDVRIIISGMNTVSVLMPQIANYEGKKQFGTSLLLDQNGGRIEYAAGASGVPGDYRLEIVAIIPDVGGGGGAGTQQNAIINRTANVDTADENSPDFVENNGDLWVKRLLVYETEVTTLEVTLPSERYDTSAATAQNGKIYVFGGMGSGGGIDDIVEFDPVAQTATKIKATLPSARENTSAATAPNGKIYVFGGRFGLLLDNIVEFDTVTQAATTLEATLPSARENTSAATAPNGKIYVFGGRVTNTNYLDDIIEFDPVAQTVTTLEVTLPDTGILSAATAPNGKIYVFGESGSIAEFDPITQSVTKLKVTLPDKQDNTVAATAPNGKIYVFGGFKVGSGALDDIVEFDPITQSVTKLEAALSRGKMAFSAATAPNGKIYVFGGNGYDDIEEFSTEAQYAYSPAVVLSQAEYTQFKNILQGIFEVGISAPSAEVSGTLSAGNTTVNGTLTATGDASAQNVTASSFNTTT